MKISFLYPAIVRRVLPFLILAAAISLGWACKGEKEAPTRMERVMAVHDSVMPEMSTISRLVGQLKPLADSTETGQAYQKAMEDLQEAHTAMMDWMKGFGDRFNHDEIMKGKELTPEKQEWLKEEEIKVRDMADKVTRSIEQAKALLKEREESGN
ncbi:MAG: hypothetical protein P8Z38_03945 [Robiginitalea sp.]|jgi:hypothetical protein